MAKTFGELLHTFLTDEDWRRRILKNHDQGLKDFGMSDADRTALNTMDGSAIFQQILIDVTGIARPTIDRLMRDLRAKHDDVYPPQLTIDFYGAYNSGGVHIFGVSPDTVHARVSTQVVIRGNGYGEDVEVQFVGDGVGQVRATVLRVTADEDLNERVTVEVTFPEAGDWRAQIKNTGDTEWWGDKERRNNVRVLPTMP